MDASSPAPPWHRVGSVASTQLGLVTTVQLNASGLGRSAIDHAVRCGRLIRIDVGVNAVGRIPENPMARFLAPVLALRGEGWLRGTSAGAAWQVLPAPPTGAVQVCVVEGGGRSQEGVEVQRVRRLSSGDRTRLGPLPVTGLARTVVDLGGELEPDALERAFAEAMVVHRLSVAAVRHALDRSPRRRGAAAVQALLRVADGPRHTRTEIERRLLTLVRDAGLPVPRTNVRVGRFVVDALWSRERVIAEADGFGSHGTRRGFEEDRRRDAELQARGFVVTRLTWRQLTDDRVAAAARLGALLAIRRRECG